MIINTIDNSLYKKVFFQSNIAIFILRITNLVKLSKYTQDNIRMNTDEYLSSDMKIKGDIDSLVTMYSVNDVARKLIGSPIDSINIENQYYENKIIKNIIDYLFAVLNINKKVLKSGVIEYDCIKNYVMHCDIIQSGNDSFAVLSVYDVAKSSVTNAHVTDNSLVGYVEKYYLLLKSMADAIILVKVDTGTIVEYNNSASVLLMVEDLSNGYMHTQFFKGKNRDKYVEYYNNILLGLKLSALEINLSTQENNIPVRINISFSHIGGEKIAQVILSDMRNELTLEKRRKLLATAIDQVGQSVVITNFSGDIEYVNSAYEEISGYSLAEVIGKKPNIFQDGKSSSYHYALMWKELSQGKVWRGNFTNKKKSGESYCEDVTISPVKGQSGEIVNFVAVNRDITQQLIIESQIRQSQKMQAIGMLAGGIAHDFNNILTAILGYAELCQMHCEKNTVIYSNIEEIVKASIRAGELVDQIREFSRHENKEISSFQIGTIVREVYKLIRPSIPPGIEIILEISDDADIKGDQTQIHQVLMNLCTNAYQSIGKNNAKIIVRLFAQYLQPATAVSIGRLQGGKYVCIQIEDSGKGIPAEYVERIFEPYFTTRKLQGGTGLGLSVVHGIVNEHRGAITVKSALGSGSCFNVYLPVAETENDENDQTPQQKKPLQSAS